MLKIKYMSLKYSELDEARLKAISKFYNDTKSGTVRYLIRETYEFLSESGQIDEVY